jgi:hypothetical protein
LETVGQDRKEATSNSNSNNNNNNNNNNIIIIIIIIIDWRIEEIKQIDRKTRKMLTMYKMHRPKADIDRLYVKEKEGGEDWYKLKQHTKQR